MIIAYFKRKRAEKRDRLKKLIAREAYKTFIGSNENLSPENVAKADAFCKGGKFALKNAGVA